MDRFECVSSLELEKEKLLEEAYYAKWNCYLLVRGYPDDYLIEK